MSKFIVGFLSFLFVMVSGLVVLGVSLFGASLLFAFPVKWLWNFVCVDLFSLPLINFWQSVCLLLLCGLLFKSSGSSSKSKE